MGQWVDIPIATQVGEDDSSYVSAMELQNLMVVPEPPGSRVPFAVVGTPSLVMHSTDSDVTNATPGSGIIRGICMRSDGTIFIVRATTAYYTSDISIGTWTMVPGGPGNVTGTSIGRLIDADVGMVFVDGTNAFVITTAGVVPCSRGNFSDVTYQDGYTIYSETGTNSLYVSNLDTPGTIGALSFTTVDSLGGTIVGIISDHRQVYVFKNNSIEYYSNTGAVNFPFGRDNPGLIERGCLSAAKLTIAKYETAIFWVGNDSRVYMMQGYQPQVISNRWVERLLRGTAAYGAAFSIRGTTYYLLNASQIGTGDLISLVYDVGTGLWHTRLSPVSSGVSITHAFNVPKNIVGALTVSAPAVLVVAGTNPASSTAIYGLSFSSNQDIFASETDEPIRIMTLPQVSYGGERTVMSELYLDMAPTTEATPVSLDWSDDGGSTYSTPVDSTSPDVNGRVRWTRLGWFYNRILRFTIQVDDFTRILGCRARIEVES